MASVTSEIEVASSFPADVVFKVFSDLDKNGPKANPETYKSFETIKGDGGVGTVKIVTFADGFPIKSGKMKVDAVDTTNFSYTYTFFEGDVLLGILDSVTNHIKVVPSSDGGSIFKQTIIYNCKGDAKPSEEALNFDKEVYKNTFKSLEAYAVANS